MRDIVSPLSGFVSPFGVRRGPSAPQILLSASSILESALVGSSVGVLSVTGQTGYAFAITADPDAKFVISGANLNTRAGFDFETAQSHSVTVQATKAGESTLTRTFTISVTNVSEQPSLGALSLPASVSRGSTVSITGATSGSTITGTMPTGWTLNGGARTITIAPDAPTGSQEWSLVETLADSANSPRASAGSSEVVTIASNTLRTGINNTPALEASTSPIALLSQESARPVLIDPTATFQTWQGTGFAMTESTAQRFSVGLSPAQRSALFSEMFGTNGFSYLRVSFGSTDQTYRLSGGTAQSNYQFFSYDDTSADGIANFSTARDDEYVVPRVLDAIAANPNLRVVAAVWSPPAVMKKNTTLTNATTPNEFNATTTNLTNYAQYLVLAIQSWQAKGVPIYAISPANEMRRSWGFPSCIWAYNEMADFVANYLKPALTAAGLTTQIWVGEEITDFSAGIQTMLADNASARAVIDSVGWHQYSFDAGPLTTIRNAYPAIAHDATEYRSLAAEPLGQVAGLWSARIANFVRNWARTFIGWGGALDENGFPNWSPGRRGIITVPADNSGNITRNVEYYALAHLGRTIPRGSVRVASNDYVGGSSVEETATDIVTLAFRKPDGDYVVWAANISATENRDATFVNLGDGQSVTRTLGPREMLSVTMPSDWETGGGRLPAATNFQTTLLSSAQRLTWNPVPGALGYVLRRNSFLRAVIPAGQTFFEDATAGTSLRSYELKAILNGEGTGANANGTATTALRTDTTLQFAAPLVTGVANTATVNRKSPGSTIAWTCSDGQSGSTTSRTFAFTPGAAGAITINWTETLAGAFNTPVATGPQAFTVSATAVTGQQFLLDTFTGTTGANINSRNGEVGATWAYKTSTGAGSGTITLTAAGATQGAGTMPSTARASAAPIHGDYDVIGVFTRTATGSQAVSVGGRCDATLFSGYFGGYNNSTGVWELTRRVNGTSTTLGTFTQPITVGQTAIGTLRMRGSQVSLLVNGAIVIGPFTDETFTGGGVDIRHSVEIGGGLGLTSIEGVYA